MHADVYRRLNLQPEQRKVLAALWETRKENRCKHDAAMRRSEAAMTQAAPPTLAGISSLLTTANEHSAAILRGHASQEVQPAGHAWGEFTAPGHASGHVGMLASGCQEPPSQGLQRAGVEGNEKVMAVLQQCGLLHGDAGSSEPPGMQGQCPAATSAAEAALVSLHGVHVDDYWGIMYFSMYFALPGEVLRLEQVMVVLWDPSLYDCGMVDDAGICLRAHQEENREKLFNDVRALAV